MLKKILSKALIVVVTMIVLTTVVKAQVDLPKTYKGDYAPITIYTGVNEAAGDTSLVYNIPAEITKGIFYVYADTITASDTLKSMIIQSSPNATGPWYSMATLTNITANGGGERKEIALLDKFIRFIYSVGGSAVSLDFTVYLTPKK